MYLNKYCNKSMYIKIKMEKKYCKHKIMNNAKHKHNNIQDIFTQKQSINPKHNINTKQKIKTNHKKIKPKHKHNLLRGKDL